VLSTAPGKYRASPPSGRIGPKSSLAIEVRLVEPVEPAAAAARGKSSVQEERLRLAVANDARTKRGEATVVVMHRSVGGEQQQRVLEQKPCSRTLLRLLPLVVGMLITGSLASGLVPKCVPCIAPFFHARHNSPVRRARARRGGRAIERRGSLQHVARLLRWHAYHLPAPQSQTIPNPLSRRVGRRCH
jgi:hypothetical protein